MSESIPFEVLQVPKPKIEKIRTPFARIMVSGTLENPYYDILYYDPNDKKFHVGYGSFCLEFVFEWLSDVFEIIEPDSVPNLLENGRTEEIEPCQITIDRQCCSCGVPMTRSDKYCPNCGIKMIRLPEKRGK